MEKRNVRVSAGAEALSVLGLVLAVVTVISPFWGRFSNEGNPNTGDLITGYFGLWTVCKDLPQGRSFCGLNVTAFNLTTWTFIAGVLAVVGVLSVGVASLVGVCLLLMLKTQERVCIPYRPGVVARLVLSILSALMATVALAMASIQSTERLPYYLSRGWTFYLQMLVIVVEVLLSLAAGYDFVLSRRLGGDPTFYSRDPSGSNALTYSNPSFKDDAGRGVTAVGGGRPGSANGSTTSSSSLNSTISNPSVRMAPNGNKHNHHNSSNGSRVHNASSSRSPSGRSSPHKVRPATGRLAAARASGLLNRSSPSRGSQRGRSSSGYGSGNYGGSSKNRPGIAVTASSGLPYSSAVNDSVDRGSVSSVSILDGSFGSIESSYGTTSSIMSGSSISSNPMALSPRKSSLKKPRPRNEVPPSPLPEGSETGSVLGFQNPGFGENRIGSIKRVRIASQSTDV